MFTKNMIRRYMEEAAADGDTAGAGGTAAADQTTQAAKTEAPASMLAAGAKEAAPSPTDFIPEKLRVMKDDGSFDLEASSRNVAQAYSALEKRMGTAGATPPKDASEYVVTVPDTLKEAFDPATDEGMKGFLSGAHAKGMTQDQVDFVMANYFEMAPKLVAGSQILDQQAAEMELKKVWSTEPDFERNVRNAYVGASAAAQKAGLDINEIMTTSPLRNDPTFLRLMAALGPEFKEDAGVGAPAMTAQQDIDAMMASAAYTDTKHPDHAKVSAAVKKHFERRFGTEAAA